MKEGVVDLMVKYNVFDVVKLDDDKEYYLLDKNMVDGNIYYYAVEYDKDIDKMLDNEFCFFKEDDGYLEDVVDLGLIEKLYNKFLNRVKDI